jgi:hypothetical protein
VYDRVRKRRSFQEALNGLFLIRDGDSQHDQFVGMVVCDLPYVRHLQETPGTPASPKVQQNPRLLVH